ncbi:uncharacterized protein LOC122509972 [Leptopilina heterotoma]|uniref:uncharacterized protein LOC122509972 n=1 Tax=Leptopilina heterotoma TaxID=63436 RepID=UPI001CA820E6|nr:uncharacterized protein LOC122509972 [Leptopilina heterotoma]
MCEASHASYDNSLGSTGDKEKSHDSETFPAFNAQDYYENFVDIKNEFLEYDVLHFENEVIEIQDDDYHHHPHRVSHDPSSTSDSPNIVPSTSQGFNPKMASIRLLSTSSPNSNISTPLASGDPNSANGSLNIVPPTSQGVNPKMASIHSLSTSFPNSNISAPLAFTSPKAVDDTAEDFYSAYLKKKSKTQTNSGLHTSTPEKNCRNRNVFNAYPVQKQYRSVQDIPISKLSGKVKASPPLDRFARRNLQDKKEIHWFLMTP